MKTSKEYSGVYQLRNTVTGECYIGSATIVRNRRYAHYTSLRKGKGTNKKLQASWDQHGEAAFEFSVLLVCGRADRVQYEQIILDDRQPELNHAKVALGGAGAGVVHTVRGVTGDLFALCQHFNVANYQRARVQVLRGWSVEDAVLSAPDGSSKIKFHTYRGEAKSVDSLAAELNVPAATIRYRISKGWHDDDLGLPVDKGRGARGKPKSAEHRAVMRANGKARDMTSLVALAAARRREKNRVHDVGGIMMSPMDIKEKYGIETSVFAARLRKGWDVHRAATAKLQGTRSK